MLNMNSYYNPDEMKTLDYHKELLKEAEKAELIYEAMHTYASKPAPSHTKITLKGFFLRLKGIKFANKTTSLPSA